MYELYNSYTNVKNDDNTNQNWNVGIYCRLSKEDEKNGHMKESESIKNQLIFLRGYVIAQGWNVKKEYKDDGYTGTNFNRPEFQTMISDIENKEINLVITKDLSRLGRDYIDTGYYIEKYFPSKNIRYIAVNDSIDTFDLSNSNNDITPFKAIINDMYARDVSKKVRTNLMTKAINGESIKSFQPYGYKKDPNNKNKILVDRNVSDVVVKIFEMYKAGKTKKQICDYLNDNKVKTPLKHKEETTNYKNPNKKNYSWSSCTITKILRDRIYVGDLVQHKYMKVNYKIKKNVKLNPSQHIIVKNNHEAIIDRDLFNSVQEMLDIQSNEWTFKGEKSSHLLSGIVYCSCGGKVTYSKNHGKIFRCICSNYKKVGSKFCNNIQYLKEDDLIIIVLENLKKNIEKYLNSNVLNYNVKSKKEKLENKNTIKNKICIIDNKMKCMYEDRLNKILSKSLYIKISKELEKKKEELYIELNEIEKQEADYKKEVKREEIENYIKNILEFNLNSKTERSIILKLVNKIVLENKKIKSISYNFSI